MNTWPYYRITYGHCTVVLSKKDIDEARVTWSPHF